MSAPKDNKVDEELFQLYLQFRLRQIQKSMLLWDDNSEKEALVNILTSCQHVNGNTLRMMFHDVFDHSVQTSTAYAQPTLAKAEAESAIIGRGIGEKRRYSTSHATSSSSFIYHNEPTPVIDNTDNGYEHSTDSEQEDSEASVYSDSGSEHEIKSKKRKPSLFNTDSSVPLPLKHLITKAACVDMEAMLKHLQVTKDIFRSRMNTIKNTFKIHYTPRNGPNSPKCRFEIINHFSYTSPMGQCQLNMIAYQLGKIEELERKEYSLKQIKANRLRYYQDLSVGLREPKLARASHLREFPRHCERALYIVRNLGAYVLFMPEVLPPTAYKKIQNASVPVLKTYLEGKFSPFKDIARFNDKDKLIVTPSAGDLNRFLEENKPYYSRFTDFSL